ncbi:MAG TPA: zinc ribbon domain-containing protein, partial [Candidatus Xenobia bacterium]
MSPKDADDVTCPRCGIPVLGTARFCPSCGTRLVAGAAAPPPPPSRIRSRRPGEDPLKRVPDAARSPVWRVLGRAVLLIALAAGGTWLWSQRSELPALLPLLHRSPAPVAVSMTPTDVPSNMGSPSSSPGLPPAVVPVPDHWTMCKSVDDKHAPVDPVETYGPHDSFYCSVHFPNMGLGVPIEARWYHEAEALKATPYLADTDGNVNLSFRLVPGSGWPPGHYSVVIYVAHQPSATMNFMVAEGGKTLEEAPASSAKQMPHSSPELPAGGGPSEATGGQSP